MLKKILLVLPPTVFLLVIVGIYSVWQGLIDVSTSTPVSATSTSTPTKQPLPVHSATPSPTPTAEPTFQITRMPTNTPPAPPETETPTYTPAATPTITSSSTPTPTPAPLTAIVAAEKLNLRVGPSSNYNLAGGLEKGDKIIILRRIPDGSWLEVKTPAGKIGWVAAKYVETPDAAKIALIPTATVGPTPTRSSSPSPLPSDSLLPFDLSGRSVPGSIDAHQEQWYIFSMIGSETVITLIFTPNVNFYGDKFQGYKVQFFLYDQNQIPFWYPDDPNVPNIGVGSHEKNDLDGDYGTGELVWRSGGLPIGTSLYLRIFNDSEKSIRYCLAPRNEADWDCPSK